MPQPGPYAFRLRTLLGCQVILAVLVPTVLVTLAEARKQSKKSGCKGNRDTKS